MPTLGTLAARAALVNALNLDATVEALVLDEVCEPAEAPVFEALVPVPTPVVFFNATGVADDQRADIALDALLGYLVGEFVAEIRRTP